MKTKPNNICPQCSAPLPPDAPAGLCPACVMAMNLATPTLINEDGSTEHIKLKAPELDEIIPLFQQLEIIELLGQGGMGVVYKARQKELDRFVALKILPREIGEAAGFAERFAREARALGKLNHSNIVTLYEFGFVDMEDGEPLYYFLMEYVDGLNLRQLLHNGRLEAREALSIVPQICDALQYAHDNGIVHRDIKPENILLDRRGNVKVADFGLAKMITYVVPPSGGPDAEQEDRLKAELQTFAESQTSAESQTLSLPGKVMGTPKYMSPEQIEAPGAVDHRADIYALGVVFYQMLTGEMPEESLQPPSSKVHIDVRLDEVVLRALEEKPDRRYQQASVLKTSIETIVAQESPRTEVAPSRIKSIPLLPLIILELLFVGFLIPLLLGLMRISVRPGILEILIVCALFGFLNYYVLKKASHEAQRMVIKIAAWATSIIWLPFVFFTLFFMNAMANETGGWHPTPNESFFVIGSILSSILLPLCAWRLFKALRSTKKTTPKPRFLRAPFIAIAVVLIGFALVTLFRLSIQQRVSFTNKDTEWISNKPSKLEQLANNPQKLKKLSPAKVIEAGMTNINLPWAWHELQRRAENGHLNREEADLVVATFLAWLKENHSEGYNQPLYSFGDFLETLSEQNLLSEDDTLLIRIQLVGAPSLELLPRMIEGEEVMKVQVRWSSPWDDDLFKRAVLNNLKSIRVDGQLVDIEKESPPFRNQNDYTFSVSLPSLSVGAHRLECEVDSAIVNKKSIEGLNHRATSADWPPAKKRWTRICAAEFRVYAKGEKLVELVDDPSRNPTIDGDFKATSVTINSAEGGAKAIATVHFSKAEQVSIPISADVSLTLGERTYSNGKFTLFTDLDNSVRRAGSGNKREISAPDSTLRTATISMKPNPAYLERDSRVHAIWNKEMVFRDVPVNRYDLNNSAQAVTKSGQTFGEQREITITRGDADERGFVFFGFAEKKWMTGLQFEYESDDSHFAKLTEEQWDWIRGNKLDVLFHFGDKNFEMLTLETQQYHVAQPHAWNTVAPEQVTSLFERLDAKGRLSGLFPAATSGNDYRDGLTSANAFRTREKLMGAYQIRKINDDHPSERGVVIRYRLLEEIE